MVSNTFLKAMSKWRKYSIVNKNLIHIRIAFWVRITKHIHRNSLYTQNYYELIQKAHQIYGPCCKRRPICITIDLILRRYFPAELCFACTVINVWLLNGANYTTKIYTFSYILFCIVIMDITLLQSHCMCNYTDLKLMMCN